MTMTTAAAPAPTGTGTIARLWPLVWTPINSKMQSMALTWQGTRISSALAPSGLSQPFTHHVQISNVSILCTDIQSRPPTHSKPPACSIQDPGRHFSSQDAGSGRTCPRLRQCQVDHCCPLSRAIHHSLRSNRLIPLAGYPPHQLQHNTHDTMHISPREATASGHKPG